MSDRLTHLPPTNILLSKAPMFTSVLVAFLVTLGDLEWTQMWILFPHYAKYIWVTSMPVAVMNVPTFAENLVREYISFLLRSIPLTTKLWFKIHKHLKSPASLSEIVWSSDAKHLGINEQRCSHSAPFVRFFLFEKSNLQPTKAQDFFPPTEASTRGGKICKLPALSPTVADAV